MFPWEGRDIGEIEALMGERDPRRYRLGVLTVSEVSAGPPAAMMWFPGRSEMGQYLARVEPRRHGLEGIEAIELRDALQNVLAGLEIRGPADTLRAAANEASAGVFRVQWWGTLEELREGQDVVGRELLAALSPPAQPPLPAKRTEELIELIRARYPVASA